MSTKPGRSLLLLLLLGLTGPASRAEADTLVVSAASSLTDAMKALGAAFAEAHPGESVTFNFAGSQILRTQIEQGAPIDVFAAADEIQMKPLAAAGLIGGVKVFTRNRLEVVASPRSGKVKTLADLTQEGVRVAVAGPNVPVGHYTLQALDELSKLDQLGASFATRVQANVVSRETNVRAVLSKVLLGEVDAGFVYRTDAAATDQVTRIEIPERGNVLAAYPIGVITGTPHHRTAEMFLNFILSGRGQEILAGYGFAR